MRFPDGLDCLFGIQWVRDVDDDKLRFSFVAICLKIRRRGFLDNCIACFAQPALEQAKNQVVWFDDKYVFLLRHNSSAVRLIDLAPRLRFVTISDHQSVTNV
jgi:hypothetical protein